MDLPTILKGAAEIGVVGVVLILVFMAYRDQNKALAEQNKEQAEKLSEVIANNTTAITKLCDSTAATVTSLADHDERAQRIENNVGQVLRVVDRTEQKVTQLHETLKGKP